MPALAITDRPRSPHRARGSSATNRHGRGRRPPMPALIRTPAVGTARAAAGIIPAPTGAMVAEGIPSAATMGAGSKARAMPRRLRRARLHLTPQAFDRLVQEALDAL